MFTDLTLFDEVLQCQICEGWESELSDHDLCQNCDRAFMLGYAKGYAQHD